MASPALGGFYYNAWIFISFYLSIFPSFFRHYDDINFGQAAYDLKEAQYGYMCLDGGSGPPNCAGNSGKYLSQITTHWEKTSGYCCGACGVDYPDCDCWTFDEDSKICTMYHNDDPSKN